MIVSIMQPAYLPWLGYFDRIARSQTHIVLDHVLIDKNSKTKFANRNKIRTREGWIWLTVPLQSSGRSSELFLNRIEIDNSSQWMSKHWRALQLNYSRAPFFTDHAPYLEYMYSQEWRLLSDLLHGVTRYLLEALGIKTTLLYSSDLGVTSQKDQLILDLCRTIGATQYISGPFGRDYLQEEHFAAAGIELLYHDYQHPVYKQVFQGFEPYMSTIDLLLNHGPASLDILMHHGERLCR